MRYGLGSIQKVDDDILLFAKQLGATDIIIHTPEDLGNDGYYEYMPMLQLRQRVEEAGLTLYAIENVHWDWFRETQLGRPGRDREIENYQKTIRNMGKAGIGVLGYNWVPNSVWRTSNTKPTRGDAKVTAFDYNLVKDAPLSFEREYSDEDMWSNYEYFIHAVAPIADEVGVRLALHPDDPPMPSLGGVARLFRNHDGYRHMLKVAPYDSVSLQF